MLDDTREKFCGRCARHDTTIPIQYELKSRCDRQLIIFHDKFLNEKGYHCEGYDPYVFEFSKRHIFRKYDFVVAKDVIEHAEDPRKFIGEVSQYLVADGILYIGTADSSNFDTQNLSSRILAVDQPFHRVIMTEDSLKSIAAEMPGVVMRIKK